MKCQFVDGPKKGQEVDVPIKLYLFMQDGKPVPFDGDYYTLVGDTSLVHDAQTSEGPSRSGEEDTR